MGADNQEEEAAMLGIKMVSMKLCGATWFALANSDLSIFWRGAAPRWWVAVAGQRLRLPSQGGWVGWGEVRRHPKKGGWVGGRVSAGL